MRSEYFTRLNIDVNYLRTRPENEKELYPWVVKNLQVMKISLKYIIEHDYAECDESPMSCWGHILAEHIRTVPEHRLWAWKVLNLNCERQARVWLGMNESDSDDDNGEQ
ncbi:hypothetical protein DIRU0_A05908 [Diutina rugosa]